MFRSQASLALFSWQAASAVECGTWISNNCLGEQDRRYDTDYSLGLIDQDAKWRGYEGFWLVELTSYGEDGLLVQPQLFDPSAPGAVPYRQDNINAFYNHTFVGSRFIMDRYYVYAPPDAVFCNTTVVPPQRNTLSTGGGVCGVNGIAYAAGGYGTSTYEKNGDMNIFKGYGLYSRSTGSLNRFVDDRTMMATSRSEGASNMNVMAWLSDDRTLVSGSSSQFTLGHHAGLQRIIIFTMAKVTEVEFLQGIRQAYADFNVLAADRVQGGVLPMRAASLDPLAYPAQEEWCATDPACSTSPYQEPEGTLRAGLIAAIVGVLAVLIIAVLVAFHRHRMKQQAHRYRERFIKRIAERIKIEGHMESLTEEQLAEEFKRIDASSDGYIQKEELKDFMMSGKAGAISESDFGAMWAALDLDGSGKVDFIEFCAFLSRCGGEYDEAAAARGRSRGSKLQNSASAVSRKGNSSLEAGAGE